MDQIIGFLDLRLQIVLSLSYEKKLLDFLTRLCFPNNAQAVVYRKQIIGALGRMQSSEAPIEGSLWNGPVV